MFRILNSVIDHQCFVDCIRASWCKLISYIGVKRVWEKLARLKQVVVDLSREKFGSIAINIASVKEELQMVQVFLRDDGINEDLGRREKDTAVKLKMWLRIEEKDARQKACISWLQLGDDNTAYFHNAMRERGHETKLIA